ncbi:MAG: ABC transporter substrate-binding protein [Actinobacteria bacterium]|nr:ABC transporter substrate-binding protein [Actinomycetota bacterium]MBV9256270.1 ABC transporter substrate-binding protein [Actinomycetota bacterium]
MRRLALLLVVALVGACGTNMSRAQIRAAAGLSSASSAKSAGAAESAAGGDSAATSGADQLSDSTAGATGQSVGAAPTAGTATPTATKRATASNCPAPCAPLVIGSVGTWSGLPGQNVVGGLDALRAWVAATNAKGGLAGHQIKLEVADDGSDPSRHRALVQEFVEQRGVVAFVYNAAVFSGFASVDYLQQKRVPVVGGAGTDPWYTTSSMFFTQVIAGDVAIEATSASYARSAKAMGMKRAGLVTCSDGVQVCQDTARKAPGYLQKYGMELAYNGQASLATPDFTSNCLAARNAGVELLYLALDGNSYQRFGRSCASIGYHPKFGIAQPVMLDEVATDPNMQGSPGVSYTFPFFLNTTPAIADFQRTMAQWAPRTKLTGSAILGWSAAKLLEVAATHLSAQPKSSDILEGLWALNGNDLGGLTAPLKFNREKPTVPPVCYWQVVVTAQQFRSPDGGTRHCEGG